MAVITLNENNPLNKSSISTTDLNYAGASTLWRYYLHSTMGDTVNLKLIYEYMVAQGYTTSAYNMDQTYIDSVIAEDPAYVADYKASYYPLAGGISGGILFMITGVDSIGMYCLAGTDFSISWTANFSTTKTVGAQTVDNEILLVSELYTNGSISGRQAGYIEAPVNISYLGGFADSGLPLPVPYMGDVLVFSGDNPFQYDSQMQAINFKYPNYVGSPNLSPYRNDFYDWIANSTLTPDKDPYDNFPPTTPDGGDGEVRYSYDIDQPELPPEALMDSGIVQMYNPTKQQLNDFMDYIYSQPDAFFTNVKKLWANPMESVISMSIVPFDVSAEQGTSEVVKFCGVSTNISMAKVKQYKQFDFGDLPIKRESNSAFDYNNYSKVKCYLPFIGIVDLNTDDVMGADLNLVYNVDLLSGDCIASIQCKKNDVTYKNRYKAPLYQYKGNVILQAPVTGNNYAGLYGGVANMIQATALPSAGSIMGAAASNILGQKVTVQRSGTLSGNTGMLGDYTPYVIIESPIISTTEGMLERQGYPTNIKSSVDSLNDSINDVWGGFTVFQKDTVFVEDIEEATDTEKQMIKDILETGVIFNKPA